MTNVAVVTGASGFIGGELCKRLSVEGWSVLRVGGRATGCDISNRTELLATREVIPDGATFFHLAGRAHEHADTGGAEDAYRRTNVDGTANVLELARLTNAKRVVFAGTVAVHGSRNETLDETSPCTPESAYGRSKLEAEALVARSGLAATTLRFPMVYGAVDRGNMTRIVRAIQRRRFPPLPALHNKRSVLHVSNAVDALVAVAEHPDAPGETFIVTDAVAVSTTEIQRTTLRLLGRRPPRVEVPLWSLRAVASVGDMLGRVLGRRLPLDSTALAKLSESAVFSNRKFVARIGVAPRKTLEDGIRSILEGLASA